MFVESENFISGGCNDERRWVLAGQRQLWRLVSSRGLTMHRGLDSRQCKLAGKPGNSSRNQFGDGFLDSPKMMTYAWALIRIVIWLINLQGEKTIIPMENKAPQELERKGLFMKLIRR